MFKQRREKLLNQMHDNSVAVIASAPAYRCGRDSDFYYLTGFDESNAIAVLVKTDDARRFIVFNQKKDPVQEQWYGARFGQM